MAHGSTYRLSSYHYTWILTGYINSPDALFPLYMISGISYGMVELIRRIIPRDIVGGDVGSMYRISSCISHLFISIFL